MAIARKERKSRTNRSTVGLEERESGAAMTAGSCALVLRLLARWAVRRAHKRGGQHADLMKEVTLDEAKS